MRLAESGLLERLGLIGFLVEPIVWGVAVNPLVGEPYSHKVPTSSEVKRSAEGGASPPSNQLLPSLFGAVLTMTKNLVTQ